MSAETPKNASDDNTGKPRAPGVSMTFHGLSRVGDQGMGTTMKKRKNRRTNARRGRKVKKVKRSNGGGSNNDDNNEEDEDEEDENDDEEGYWRSKYYFEKDDHEKTKKLLGEERQHRIAETKRKLLSRDRENLNLERYLETQKELEKKKLAIAELSTKFLALKEENRRLKQTQGQ